MHFLVLYHTLFLLKTCHNSLPFNSLYRLHAIFYWDSAFYFVCLNFYKMLSPDYRVNIWWCSPVCKAWHIYPACRLVMYGMWVCSKRGHIVGRINLGHLYRVQVVTGSYCGNGETAKQSWPGSGKIVSGIWDMASSWQYPFVIGWSKYRWGLHQLQWVLGLHEWWQFSFF